ncbi:MAG: putative Ig domain-containing protein [Sphingopyxis sp.]|uniref:putative Ig domain-containing protein n=1 Tax=Sphingopyxis sp. TaxID=1908224 RepID=UPI002ABB1014|nr:putative Ig domain-containing protein [Sphingopyxis sp.]MDZ3832818.1 putative Ig domain-containing protein [Sphingopyxis sp.]
MNRFGAVRSLLSLFLFLLLLMGAAPQLRAQGVFPCDVDSTDIAGLTFVNPLGDVNDFDSYALGGVLTGENVRDSGACGPLANINLRPLLGGEGYLVGVRVDNATQQGGTLVRYSANEVRYLPPSHSFSGTDTFTVDNNNTGRVITVRVNVLPAALPPVVTSLSPSQGPAAGATSVVLTGTDFSGASAVTFGATAATAFTVNSATQITATSPAGTGTVNVRVTTANGTSAAAAGNQFTYVAAPTVTAVSPGSGSAAGGTAVVITGTNLTGASAVTFGGTAAASFTVNSATQITATSPPGTGTVNVRVTTVGGTSATAAANQYSFIAAPTVTGLSPTSGPAAGGTTVVITGTNLTGASAVTFGGTAATGFTVNSATQITATSPAGTGTGNVRVTTVGGTSATAAANQYSFIPAPTVAGLSPTSGPAAGGTTVVITGSNLSGASAVTFGGTAATGFTVNSSTQITATSPAGAGAVDVRVTTVGGTSSVSASDQFTYVAPPTAANGNATVAYGSAANAISLTLGGGAATSVAVVAPASNGVATAAGTSISYTPTAGYAGPDSFTYTATNAGGTSSAATVTITVTPPTVDLAPASLAAPSYGAAYSATITASGGAAAYSYAVTAGALPSGLTLAGDGTLSGTTTATGPFGFTVTATDSSTGPAAPFSGSRGYNFTIASPTIVLTPAAGALPAATAGASYSQSISASGGVGPYGYAVTAGTLPTGLTLNASTGEIGGIPTSSGPFSFTVTATDANSFTGSAAYSIAVALPTLAINGTPANGRVGDAYNETLTANGGIGPYSFSLRTGTPPDGISFSSAGVFSGTPTEAGSFNMIVRATDQTGGTGPATVDRNITLVIGAPTVMLDPASLGGFAFGTPVSATVVASGGTAPYSYSIVGGALPDGLSMNAGGAISGTPTTPGNFNFTVQATDSSTGGGAPFSGTRNYTVAVGGPTVILSPAALPDPGIGQAYSQTVSASGGTAPYTFGVTAGALPPGLTLSTSGVISGTATASGAYNFTVTATDSTGGLGPYTAAQSYSLNVGAATVAVSPTTLPAPVYNTPYNQNITASGGTAPYSYAITAGALPSGLALAPDGTLSGTPLAVGSFAFTVTATDSSGGTGPFSGNQAYNFTIAAPVLALVPPAGGLPNAAVGVAYGQSLGATGGVAPYSYAVTSGALPAGVVLATDGALSGTPTAGGTFSFTVTVTDSGVGGPFSASAAYSLDVASPSIAVTPASLPSAMMEAPYSASLSASGGTGPYSYAVSSGALPGGLTLSPAGVVSGTPTVHGTFAFTVTATDSSGGTGPFTGSQAYAFVVSPPLAPVANPVSANIAYGSADNPIALDLAGGTATGVAVVTPPSHGTATVSGLAISYTPTPGYSGPDSFTYSASNDGGTSAPAAVTISVASPVVTVGPANLAAGQQGVAYSATLTASGGAAPYRFAVTAGALPAGLSLATNGIVSGTPTENGAFAFTITATDSSTGTGPFTAAISYTLQIALPAAPVARNAPDTTVTGTTVPNAASVDIDLAALVDGEYTDIRVDTQPEHGTVTVAGNFVATYRPAVAYQGADAFTFVAVGPGGTSSPARAEITVVGAVPVAPSLTATLLNGREVILDVTTGAQGGPFNGAAVTAILPANSLAAEVVEGGAPGDRSYGIKLRAIGRFSGSATIHYTLANAFGVSEPATISVMVEARPDPSADPVVRGLSAAQAEAARRFASTQLDNFARRNEQLHGSGAASRGQSTGVRLSGGDGTYRGRTADNATPAGVVDMRALGGVELADASPDTTQMLAQLAASDRDTAPAGARTVGSIEIWSGGAIQIGTRDATSRRSKLRVSSSGLSAGVDVRLSDSLTIGIGGGYGFDRTKVGQNDEGRLDAENWVTALYGSLSPGKGVFIDGVFGMGGLDFETRRRAPNGATARGARDGTMTFASLAAGVDESTDRWRLSSYARIEYMAARLKAYEEAGAGIYDLAFAERKPRSFTSIIGTRGMIAVPSDIGLLTPRARVEWRHEFNRSGAQALDYADIAGTDGLGYGYLIRDDNWLRDEIQIEVGIGLEALGGWTFGLDLGGRFGSGTVLGTAKLSASTRF